MEGNCRPLPIGQSDFREVRRAGAYYVDKSLFIQEVIQANAQVLLLPRPRRFGKTLNLSMLRYFFERDVEDGAALFTDLAISRSALAAQHQGKYPVIYLTFKDQQNMSWDAAQCGLMNLLRDEFGRHRRILQTDILTASEKRYFDAILADKAAPRDYEDALRYLSSYLSRFYGERVVILIDEYDTPIQSGYTHGYYEEIISFMRNLLSGGLKDNRYLFKGVLTGILRVAKESIFSGLNNLSVYTLLSLEFNTAFGFTDPEVRQMLADYALAERYAEVAHWYNGYLFGGAVIYNPWSVLNYVASKDKQPRPYWVNTGGTELIEELLTRGGRELRGELERLLEGQTITQPIYDTIIMRDLDTRDNLVWSFLLFSGYLKCAARPVRRNWYELTVPNEEIRWLYEDLIARWFEDKIDLTLLQSLLAASERGDVTLFERMLRLIAQQVMSYHDLSGAPEKVYQALVLGMLVWLGDKYEIRTNREAGYGRYDMMFKPRQPGKSGIVMEFKQVYADETPETVLAGAMQQITAKQYTAELVAAGVADILCLAVAFRGKEVWVRGEQQSAA